MVNFQSIRLKKKALLLNESEFRQKLIGATPSPMYIIRHRKLIKRWQLRKLGQEDEKSEAMH